MKSKNGFNQITFPQSRVYNMKENAAWEENDFIFQKDNIEFCLNNIITDNTLKVEKTQAINKSNGENRVQK